MFKTTELNNNLEELWQANNCMLFQVTHILFRIPRNRKDHCSNSFNKLIKGEF
jgi:hypothetical protein